MNVRVSGLASLVALAFFGTMAEALQIPIGAGSLDAEGKLEGRYVQRLESSNPREDPQGKLRLRLGSDLSRWLRVQTEVAGVAGGPPHDPDAAGVYNLDDTLQDLSPSLDLEEAYLDLYLPSVDARIGVQKFAWGKLDAIQPNDLLNPEEYYDPIIEDESDRKIGVPAVSTTVYVPVPESGWLPNDLRVTGVWVPVPVAWRFPDDDERWYPPLARVPRESESNGLTVRNESRILNGDAPGGFEPPNLSEGAGAARVAALFQGADVAFYYYDGYDPQPILDVAARGFVRLNATSPQFFDVRSEIDIFPVFDRIRSAGLDVAYNFLGATIRGEAAYVMGRLYPRSIRTIVENQEVGEVDLVTLLSGEEQEVAVTFPPVNIEQDAVEWGFGADYSWEETFFLVQMNQTTIIGAEEDLLISDWETRIAATVRRSFFDENLEAELIGYYGLQGVYGLAQPRLTWNVTDDLDVRIGYLVIEGHFTSFLGQYRDNDEAYVRVRFSF